MKKHLKYLQYVLRHKWYVLIEGRKLKIPLWRLLIHDWQKFTPTEWNPYVLSFYGPYKYKERPQWLVDSFNKAWLHHIHYGPHHWQHWLLMFDNDKKEYETIIIPDVYSKEMLADWRAAGIAITGQDNTKQWYLERHKRFTKVIHPVNRRWIKKQLEI